MKLSSEKKFGKAKLYPARHSLPPGGPLCHEKAQKARRPKDACRIHARALAMLVPVELTMTVKDPCNKARNDILM